MLCANVAPKRVLAATRRDVVKRILGRCGVLSEESEYYGTADFFLLDSCLS